jgi:AcrR family transcriptional regulator
MNHKITSTSKAGNRKPVIERKKEILIAARKILVEDGYHQFTMRSLASKVGIKLASLQYHFPTKEIVLRELMNDASDYYQSSFKARFDIKEKLTPEQKLSRIVDFILDDHDSKEMSAFFIQLEAMAITEESAAKALSKFYQAYWNDIVLFITSFNSKLSKTEKKIRSAVIISLLEGSGIFLTDPALSKALPNTYKKYLKRMVLQIITQK